MKSLASYFVDFLYVVFAIQISAQTPPHRVATNEE